jgi:hypothetical protein
MSMVVEEEPQEFFAVTVYFLAGQLSTCAMPSTSQLAWFSFIPSGSAGEMVHLVMAAYLPALLVTRDDSGSWARVSVNGVAA